MTTAIFKAKLLWLSSDKNHPVIHCPVNSVDQEYYATNVGAGGSKSLYSDMNYQKHYNALIERAKSRNLEGYSESHHIIPRCIGGTDHRNNLVSLTPEEHYTAHLLLVRIYPGCHQLVHAAHMMTVGSTMHCRNNKVYGWLKRRYSQVCSLKIGKLNPSYGKPWFVNPRTGENGKFVPGFEPEGWIPGRVVKKDTTSCSECGNDTFMKAARYCKECATAKRSSKAKPTRATKTKTSFSVEEKREALLAHQGNVRQALFSLGLSCGGTHYSQMKEIKASLYPLATNQLKG